MKPLELTIEKSKDALGEDLDHFYCCDENVALCGSNLEGHPEVEMDSSTKPCVVCVDLEWATCSKCGE